MEIRIRIASVAAGTILTLVACGTETTKSPERHQERLQKAAGIETFYIECRRDLWELTSSDAQSGSRRQRSGVEGEVIEEGAGHLSRIRLSGRQLADYLRVLDYRAHPPSGDGLAEAVRMYDEIARELDGIKTKPPADAPPLTIVDDGFLSTPPDDKQN